MTTRTLGTGQSSRNVLITGATGFLGSNFALHLLLEGAGQVFALVRSSRDCQERLTEAVREAARAAGLVDETEAVLDRLTAITGDLTKHGLGIAAADLERLRGAGVAEIWHCAASLQFEPQHQKVIWENNVTGTRRVLELAGTLQVANFHHISTAYVAGQRRGHIPEERDDPRFEPNNCYEASKRQAEDLLLQAQQRGDFRVRIFRPSIVIGNSTTFDCTSTTGPNGFMAGADRFKEEMDDKVPGYLACHPLRVHGEPGTTMDLIPVDLLVREALALARDPAQTGTFYHLTNPYPVPLERTIGAMNRAFPELEIEIVADETALRPADTLFHDKLRFYNPYLQNDKRFERARDNGAPTAELAITEEDMARYIARFLVRLRAEKEPTARKATQVLRNLHRRTFRCRLGKELTYYTRGEGPALVLLNAYAVSLEFWKKVLAGLPSGYRIITWECRGLMTGPGEQLFGVVDQAEDLREILDHAGVQRAHLIAWCTGPKVALEFQARYPQAVASLALLTGSYGPLPGCEGLTTRYDQVIGKMADLVCRRPEMATVFLRTVAGMFSSEPRPGADADSPVADLMGMVSPRWRGLISGPFLSEHVIRNYARLVADFQRHDISHLLERVAVPTLVLAAANDVIAHPGLSAAVAQRIAGAQSVCLAGASHWCLMESSAELVAELTGFLGSLETSKS